MAPPGNATAPPHLASITLRTSALVDYPAIDPEQFLGPSNGRVALITGSGRNNKIFSG